MAPETDSSLVTATVDSSWATVVLFVDASPDHFMVGLRSILDRTDLPVVVGTLHGIYMAEFAGVDPRVTVRMAGSVSQLINETFAELKTTIVVVDDAVSFPPAPFSIAASWLANDLRYSSVSFLSNAAGFLSFPGRNQPEIRPPDGHDEHSITRRLRSVSPAGQPTPVRFGAGPVVVLSSAALSAVGQFKAPASARLDVALADFCARARAKGFIDVADTSTYISRSADVAVRPINDDITPDDRGWLLHRHRSLEHYLDHEQVQAETPFAVAHRVARVKLQGIRILLDGSCFGPNEVGTQVATQHTVRALASSEEVAEVAVALPGPIPQYAAPWLSGPKIRTLSLNELHTYDRADVAFRPYQPVPGWDLDRWRAAAPRLVVSILDTIAFHNGGYFDSSEAWMAYRDFLTRCVGAVDAVTVISDDVVGQMRLHGLPIADARLFSVPLGTEHLDGNAPSMFPRELEARGFSSGAFALCLGVNYTHKNRELARRAHALLRDRGHELVLVFAGASVPFGSSRLSEAYEGPGDHVVVLPELRSDEKNWLLKHASIVWYPTSAEGFGLVPFEAAVFGTPTVAVDFGPIHELLRSKAGTDRTGSRADHLGTRSDLASDVPVLAKCWSAEELAGVAERLLTDADLRRRHVEAVRDAGHRYDWTTTAQTLTTLFREVLATPRR